MHIIYIHQYFTTPDMSGGTRSFEMAKRVVAAGHRVSMITSNREADANSGWYTTKEAGIEVHWLPVAYSNQMSYPKRIWAFVRFAIASARKAASIRGDLIFATSTPLTVAIPALYASWRQNIPMGFEVRDMWPAVPIAMGAIRNPLLVWLARLLERTAYRRSSHIVALAPGMKEDVVATGIPAEKVTVIPNGCDLDVFGKTMTKEIGPREKHDWLTDRKLVVFTGTLGKANGVSYMAHVAACVKAIDPEIRFVVVGDGADAPNVRSAAMQCGVLDSTFFMFPSLPKHEAAQWVRGADVVMCLFTGPRVIWKDAVQNKFFDAVAAGKPTASNFEGFQSLVAVEHGIGVILDSKDHVVAAKQLVETLNNAQWLAGVESRSRVLAEGEFSRDHLAQRLLTVLANTMTSDSC